MPMITSEQLLAGANMLFNEAARMRETAGFFRVPFYHDMLIHAASQLTELGVRLRAWSRIMAVHEEAPSNPPEETYVEIDRAATLILKRMEPISEDMPQKPCDMFGRYPLDPAPALQEG